jgi:hypothetical protein
MPAVAFADVLDRAVHHGASSSSPGSTAAGISTAPLPGAASWHWRGAAVFARTGAARPSRPVRRLTRRQQAALETVRRSGAPALRDDFLHVELKAEFRRLARALHPDMHRTASPGRQQALAAQFCEVRHAYEELCRL